MAYPRILVSLLVLSLPTLCRGVDVADLLAKVQARYDATGDFTADVTQELTIASLNKTSTARGTVAFKKPGKMRWELSNGERQVIVADGSTLWLYQPDEQQVLKAPFDAAFRSTTPISFLTGVGRIAQDFDAVLNSEGSDAPTVRLTLTPKKDSAAIGTLHLIVDRDTGDIRGAEIGDPLGNISRLHFTQMRRNVGLDDQRFVFQVPPGVDVVGAPLVQ